MYELELILSEEKGRKLLGLETTLFLLFQATISLKKGKNDTENRTTTVLLHFEDENSLFRTQSYVESVCEEGEEGREERVLPLPPQIYHALAGRKTEISAHSTAHIVWDNESCSMLVIGSRDTVDETALVLGQFVSGNRKLSRTETDRHSDKQTLQAKNLLLMTKLPPELTISNRRSADENTFSQFSGLPSQPRGQKVAPSIVRKISDGYLRHDSHVTYRRKLEPEDSSYDSDHEFLSSSRSSESAHTLHTHLRSSSSHDDISRSASETLGQEYAEYVTYKKSGSRDSSPTLSERLEGVRESPGLESVSEDPGDVIDDIYSITHNPNYNTKVEFALKLGYPEPLTQRALLKVGFNAQQNELLDELIRLQQLKGADPKELLLKEAHELLSNSLSAPVLQLPRPSRSTEESNLRHIVIDGSNVAMSHGNKERYSCLGIQLCVEWFQNRGHKDITVFVPSWRKESSKPETPTTAQHILIDLEKQGLLSFTPSRQVGGRRVVPLDDRYILNLAAATDAVVVSNDNFRELINEKPEFRKVVEERILMFSFVNDRFMPPDDPLGRNGPTLDAFLRINPAPADMPPPCPYGKKCTYGNKCKFYHAERGTVPHKSVTDRLKEHSIMKILEVRTRNTSRDSSPGDIGRTKSMNLVLQRTESDTSAFSRPKQSLTRTRSSRPAISGSDKFSDSLLMLGNKTDITKSHSTDNRFGRPTGDWSNLEMGCLNNYGLRDLIHTAPPPPGPWNTMVPPPAPAQDGNSHRRLERQLTINPSFDPRINKPRFPKSQDLLSTEAMEYMHRNPPPPFGITPESNEFNHQNVTRIASAPDSLRQWGSSVISPPVTVVEPLNLGVLNQQSSPIQRNSSTSDSQLNRTLSAGPFLTDTWSFDSGITPILTPSSSQLSSIWGPLPAAQSTPQASPNQSILGPVGSRPVKDSRLELKYHLSALFPQEQVEQVLTMMPDEYDPKTLCAAIMKMFPPT